MRRVVRRMRRAGANRPFTPFFVAYLTFYNAIRRGEEVHLLKCLTRKNLNGRNFGKSTFSLVLSFFALEKRKYI